MNTFRLLFASGACAAALAAAPVAHSAVLNIEVLDNGTLVGSAVSTFGIATFQDAGILDPNFSSILVRADGPPLFPGADLSTVTLNISASAGFVGTHTLTIDVFQTGVSALAGSTTNTSFTVNNLIGVPGPTTESTYFNGTSSTLGTLLQTAAFPAGTSTESIGPLMNTLGMALTADAQQYVIKFATPVESANDTIQLTTVAVPEPSTWAMLVLGFAGIGLAGLTRRRKGLRYAL